MNDEQIQTKPKSLLAASTETVVLDCNKNQQTPFTSKIPVFHSRSDDGLSFCSEDMRKNRKAGLNFIQPGSLKRICSNSKIPVSTRKPFRNTDQNRHFLPTSSYSFKQVPNQSRPVPKRTEKNCSGKYTHVKSKLAAYIHRPMKTDCPKINRSTSPLDKRLRNDSPYSNFSCIRRISSRSSLDTYTCDNKMVSIFFFSFSFSKTTLLLQITNHPFQFILILFNFIPAHI